MLHRKKGRDATGCFLVEGVRAVEAAIWAHADLVDLVLTDAAQRTARIAQLLDLADVPVWQATARQMAALTDVQTDQGLLVVAKKPSPDAARLYASQRILALNGVQDPGNVGTLIRTAAWLGIDAVLAGSGTADFFNPKVVRATMGGLWAVQFVQTASVSEALQLLKNKGFTIYSADLKGTNAADWQPVVPSVLVLGSEAHGLSQTVRSVVDESVFLVGQSAAVESLNVSVAGGILMHDWCR